MRAFEAFNPAAVFIYIIFTAAIPMFSMNPVILTASLVCALSFWFVRNGRGGLKSHLWFLGLFMIITLANPLLNHNGRTVLFVLNNNPVTLEACCYGAAMGCAAVSIIYWFRSFTQIMTSDKIMYVFGSVSPKTSLIISMALRYVPLFTSTAEKTRATQRALGLYSSDDTAERLRGETRVFSTVVTWALENGIVTADSMAARGYSTGRRTSFAIYRFGRQDALLSAVFAAFFALCVAGIATGATVFEYYPDISAVPLTPTAAASYAAYLILAAAPTLIDIGEGLRWKYLQSKI